MATWAPIQYREFWDVPRIFIVPFRQRWFLFDCRFNEATEDFPNHYQVYLLHHLEPGELTGSWDDLHRKAVQFIATVPIEQVHFDASKRREVDVGVLEELTSQAGIT